MREFLTRITFARVLVLTVLGAVYVGFKADLPSRKPRREPSDSVPTVARSRPIHARARRRVIPVPPSELQSDSHSVALPGQSAAGDVKPLAVWRGTLPEDQVANDRPAGTVVTDLKTWQEIWNRLRGAEPPPTIDFQREVVVLGTVPGANVAALKVWRDANGNTRLTIFGSSTPATRGGYILARFDRAKIDISKMRNAGHRSSKG